LEVNFGQMIDEVEGQWEWDWSGGEEDYPDGSNIRAFCVCETAMPK